MQYTGYIIFAKYIQHTHNQSHTHLEFKNRYLKTSENYLRLTVKYLRILEKHQKLFSKRFENRRFIVCFNK